MFLHDGLFRLGKLSVSRHKRRDRYWRLYDFARSRELLEVVDELARLVDEVGDLWPKPKRGRPTVHSPMKMAVICILTVILGFSYRRMEALLHMLRHSMAVDSLFQTTAPFMKPLDESLKLT